MIVEESVHMVFDEVDHKVLKPSQNSTEQDEQNIIMQKLDCCPEKQPIDSSKQPVEILQQDELPKEWRIPRDLSVENIIGQIKEGFLHVALSQNSADTLLLSFKLNQSLLKKLLKMKNG